VLSVGAPAAAVAEGEDHHLVQSDSEDEAIVEYVRQSSGTRAYKTVWSQVRGPQSRGVVTTAGKAVVVTSQVEVSSVDKSKCANCKVCFGGGHC
jgi:hypothetical protein